MKIAILVFRSERKNLLPGSASILESATARNHKVTIIHEDDLQIRFGSKSRIFMNNSPLPKYDAIITRPVFNSDPSIHSALIRQLELDKRLVINGNIGVHRTKNKIRTLQLLDNYGLPTPKTLVLFGLDHLQDALSNFTFPVVLKTVYGAAGTGIFIAESKRSVKPLAEYILKSSDHKYPIKIQEYIKESKGKDIRIFVIGKKVVAAMQRSAKRGEFRSNFHQGGKVKSIELTAQEKKLAIAATKHTGLDIAGVDILRTNRGPMILEVNSAPGFEAITKATGADIGSEVIKYVEKLVKAHKKVKPSEKKSKKSEN